ncbi:hypothetical protein NECAME_07012 [Necator americanus]|uniref:Uncharacterized protein n=1 Tax=Necator americanus TaxID=51031 RepID=W2TSU4_NECAM|nr:hypothetical protein NECAME_07012 [Necator americanus]ETN84191.1 hypothetical protein NECAME_07012 [Necator americanus]
MLCIIGADEMAQCFTSVFHYDITEKRRSICKKTAHRSLQLNRAINFMGGFRSVPVAHIPPCNHFRKTFEGMGC